MCGSKDREKYTILPKFAVCTFMNSSATPRASEKDAAS